MFPKKVFSEDIIIEACQYWTNFKKYVTTHQNTILLMKSYVKHFWPPYQEEPIIGFKLLGIPL